MNHRIALVALACAACTLPVHSGRAQPTTAAGAASAAAGDIESLSDGVIIPVPEGLLRLQVRGDSLIRVAVAADRKFFGRESLILLPPADRTTGNWRVNTTGAGVTLRTPAVEVRVDRRTGAVSFFNAAGEPILAERAGGRKLADAFVQGVATQHIQQVWEPHPDESLHGLGQHQLGLVDIKHHDLDLWQHNATVALPLLVSNRGYGILWDNPSYTRFGDLRPWQALPTSVLTDADGQAGALTATYFGDADFKQPLFRHRAEDININIPKPWPPSNTSIHPGLPAKGPVSVRWEGTFKAEKAGDYLFQTTANNGASVWINGQLISHSWWQDWLPYPKQGRIALQPGTHQIRVDWSCDDKGSIMQLRWKTPTGERPTTLWSEVGEGLDYTFIYGPRLDDVIAGYRELTGRATLMPIWTLGLWQSRQRYETAQQSLDVVAEYRKRGIALDNIVQDWFYWERSQWGSHAFDPQRFPDPQGWIDALHRHNVRVMISVWGKFYPGNPHYAALHERGFLYQPLLWEGVQDWIGFPYTNYDAFHPKARQLFWSQMRDSLFTKKIDAWWMDATEPDVSSPPQLDQQKLRMNPTAGGFGARVLNAYALVNSRAVYEGQRETAPDQRVFILTRSAFGGIQRYASATWSGDIASDWESMHRQIACGLGFSISGVPYWSMDIGGFSMPPRFRGKISAEAREEWYELAARWFQFGSFVPLVRLHGETQLREAWEFGGEKHPASRTVIDFNRLRYRLLPYVYSVAGAVTHDHASFLRPLVMDFPQDATARTLNDQYLFGPALLVAPVTEYRARSRQVYLPAAPGGWFDFWTGTHHGSAGAINVSAPLERMPLLVRAGSIVPFGPDLQYTTEKPADPLTLYVYAGADGSFHLYEDDGVSYGYERGAFTRIPLEWNDADRTLTIGARRGSFPGSLAKRTIHVILVTPGKASGYAYDARPDRTVTYSGEKLEIVFR